MVERERTYTVGGPSRYCFQIACERERARARRKKVIVTRDRIGKSDVRCGGGGCVIVIGDEENKKLATKKCSYNIGDICSLL